MLEMRSARSFLISLLVAAFALASCSLSPEAKKKKFLEKGAAYSTRDNIARRISSSKMQSRSTRNSRTPTTVWHSRS